MAVEARAPCGDCNNNNNNKVVLIVILIKITTDFIFMTVFPEIFLNSHEITFIRKRRPRFFKPTWTKFNDGLLNGE
jgi:hypothetical protein